MRKSWENANNPNQVNPVVQCQQAKSLLTYMIGAAGQALYVLSLAYEFFFIIDLLIF